MKPQILKKLLSITIPTFLVLVLSIVVTQEIYADHVEQLYMGATNEIYVYDGSNWTPTDPRLTAISEVRSIVKDDSGNLYVAGLGGGGVYKYDGTAWTSLGLTSVTNINTLAYGNGTLYAGGYNYAGVYKYTGGTNWDYIGFNSPEVITGLAVYNGNLYAGGNQNYGVRVWNGGTSWTDMGVSGYSDSNLWVAQATNTLYVYGIDTSRSYGKISKYDGGTAWTSIYNNSPHTWVIMGLAMDSDGDLFAAGSGYGTEYVFKYLGGTSWVETGFDNSLYLWINSLTADDAGNVYASGVGSGSWSYGLVSKYDGTSWSRISFDGSKGFGPVIMYGPEGGVPEPATVVGLVGAIIAMGYRRVRNRRA
ncbi:MAG: PEP-CTERM sorting domain-containing protein [Candidatus Omnitrophica bacterium]|nr:PEP-CTERM sorting domain-containing protein [Candidatus Omnitrophota bacterium]